MSMLLTTYIHNKIIYFFHNHYITSTTKNSDRPIPQTHLRRGTVKGSPETFDKIRCPEKSNSLLT